MAAGWALRQRPSLCKQPGKNLPAQPRPVCGRQGLGLSERQTQAWEGLANKLGCAGANQAWTTGCSLTPGQGKMWKCCGVVESPARVRSDLVYALKANSGVAVVAQRK